MIGKPDILKLFKKEFATTLKVMKAFPGDKLEFKPHERSQSAKRIMSTFVFEMYLLESYVFGGKIESSAYSDYSPAGLEELIGDFEKWTSGIISKTESMDDETLAKEVNFAGKKFNVSEFMIMMLSDQIHHRGQMSVYIRMAGGKVPSIYGPSADDQSTNL